MPYLFFGRIFIQHAGAPVRIAVTVQRVIVALMKTVLAVTTLSAMSAKLDSIPMAQDVQVSLESIFIHTHIYNLCHGPWDI